MVELVDEQVLVVVLCFHNLRKIGTNPGMTSDSEVGRNHQWEISRALSDVGSPVSQLHELLRDFCL